MFVTRFEKLTIVNIVMRRGRRSKRVGEIRERRVADSFHNGRREFFHIIDLFFSCLDGRNQMIHLLNGG